MEHAVDTVSVPIPSVSPQELAARIGRADTPVLLDVRRAPAFRESPLRLAGALRCDPADVAAFAAAQPPRDVVVYCVYGHSVSAEAVATLRAAGWPAARLEGGISGGEAGVDTPGDMARWRTQPVPTVRQRPDWGVTGERASRWATRARPKIDRIACPWLVRRFIDPHAEFFYVPTAQVLTEAARLDAVAFDMPGAPVSHDGALCSFDTLLRAFDLRIPALDTLARIVRGADTDRVDLAPQSAGLLALSLGLSRLHADDQAMLHAALPLYDALYAWCCDTAGEAHAWKPETMVSPAGGGAT